MFNGETPSKPEGPPPPVQKSAKILNLANIISNSLSSSTNNLNILAGGDKNKEKDKNNTSPYNTTNITVIVENDTKIVDIGSITPSRPTSSHIPNSDSTTAFGTQINYYSNAYNGDSGSSSFSNSKQNSYSSLNGIPSMSSMNGINMTAIASAAASIASHNMKNINTTASQENINEIINKKPISPTAVSFNLPSPQSPTISITALTERIKKLEFSKTGMSKKCNAEKYHLKLIQQFIDFINSINKNKKGTYLDQCNDIKNTIKKFLMSANIINQDCLLTASTSNQINLYYTAMLSLSKMILNVRDATGQWPPPDANQLIFVQIDDFVINYQLLLNSINFATINSNENGSELSISSPIINTNPSFLASVDLYGSNALLNKIDHQISIIMMSISDLVLISRKEQSINQNIYKLSVECRDNISTLSNYVDDIHFKKRYAIKFISQFIHKKETLMNSIKELTITIKSANEKFAPSNSLELILESLSNCINIIDDISIIVKGIYDISDSPCISQQNSFDMTENSCGQDSYEFNKKLFGDQSSVINGAFSKKLECALKV